MPVGVARTVACVLAGTVMEYQCCGLPPAAQAVAALPPRARSCAMSPVEVSAVAVAQIALVSIAKVEAERV
jgi:hypothetical protein